MTSKLSSAFRSGLQASGLTTAPTDEGKAASCGPACVRRICQRSKTRYAAGARISVRHSVYRMHLWIADGTTGKLLATVNEICKICPPVAAGTKLELAASRLAVALRERAKKPAVFAITSDPAGADVFVGDELKGQTPLRLELPPGAYVVEARKAGYYSGKRELRAVAGVEEKVNYALIPEPRGPSRFATIAGWSAIGVGAASIVGGIVMLAMDGKDTDCRSFPEGEFCAQKYDTAVPGWILIGGGAALAGGGAALLFWPRGGSKKASTAFSTKPRFSVAPTGFGGARGLSMSLSGRF